jgi:hypothetical protein
MVVLGAACGGGAESRSNVGPDQQGERDQTTSEITTAAQIPSDPPTDESAPATAAPMVDCPPTAEMETHFGQASLTPLDPEREPGAIVSCYFIWCSIRGLMACPR